MLSMAVIENRKKHDDQKSMPPSIRRTGAYRDYADAEFLLHVDRRTGGINPTFPDFLSIFSLLHDHFLLFLSIIHPKRF